MGKSLDVSPRNLNFVLYTHWELCLREKCGIINSGFGQIILQEKSRVRKD